MNTLTDADYAAAAELLQCDVAVIEAVAEVESAGAGFQPDGRLKLLFERHHFSRLTGGKYDATHPEISNRKPGGYTKDEWARYERAAAIDAEAAAKSTSWGKFQIMGFNHEACGYLSALEMQQDFATGEAAQLRGFVKFILASAPLTRAIRKCDWASFARCYNGPSYKQNKYDEKMAAAYKVHGGSN